MNDTDIDERIAQAMAFRTHRNDSDEVREAADELRMEISRAHNPARRGRTARVGAATASVAAAAAFVVFATTTNTTPSTNVAQTTVPQNDNAIVFLHAAASKAASTPAGSGAYWHYRIETTVNDGTEANGRTHLNDIWISETHDGRVAGRVIDLNGTKREEKSFPPSVTNLVLGNESYRWADLQQLPTNAAALGALLRQRAGEVVADPVTKNGVAVPMPSADSILLDYVGALLTSVPVAPEVRSALFEVAASVPGVRSEGTVKDLHDRSGTAISWDVQASGKQTMIFAADCSLLEKTYSWSENGTGHSMTTTFLETGFTDSIS